MKEPSPIHRVLASPLAALIAVLGLLALSAAARDVPQGMDASRVLEAFGRGSGPFVVVFGLHRLGESFFLWSAIGLLALHLVAVRLRSPSEGAPGMSWKILPAVLLLPLLPLSQRLAADPDPLRDPIRLSVRGPSGSGTSYKVEEGSAYRLPGTEGTLLFGTLSFGPWSGEAAQDGSLRLHLPVPGPGTSPSFQVSARRPPVIDTWAPSTARGIPLYGTSLAASLLAAFLLVLGAARLAPHSGGRAASLGVLAIMAWFLLAPLWIDPEGPRLPLISRASGAPVLFGALIRTPQDVAPWVGAMPIRFPASTAAPLLRGSLALLALTALFRLVRPSGNRRGPDRPVRVIAAVLAIGGIALAVMAALRSPLSLEESALSAWIESRYLALVPSSWSVLETSVSAPGPWALSWTALSLHALVLLALGGSLWYLSGKPRPEDGPPLPLGPFAIALALLALLQAAGCLWMDPSNPLPEAALPSSLLVALLALLGFALPADSTRRLQAGPLCLAAASLLQLSMVL